jgi:hypothetical protein
VTKRSTRKRDDYSSDEGASQQDFESQAEDVDAAVILSSLPGLHKPDTLYSMESYSADTPSTQDELLHQVKIPKKRGRKKKVVVDEHIIARETPKNGTICKGND